jgi:hypothetical protein
LLALLFHFHTLVILAVSENVNATSIAAALLLPSRFQPSFRFSETPPLAAWVVVVVVVTVVVVVVANVDVVVVVVVVLGREVLVPVKLPLTPKAIFDQVPLSEPELELIEPVNVEPVEVEPTVICNAPLVDICPLPVRVA